MPPVKNRQRDRRWEDLSVFKNWPPSPQRRSQPPSESTFVRSGYEHQLSRRRRALEPFVRATSVGQRQALRDNRMDLACTEQLQQSEEVLPEPIWVTRTSTARRARPTLMGST